MANQECHMSKFLTQTDTYTYVQLERSTKRMGWRGHFCFAMYRWLLPWPRVRGPRCLGSSGTLGGVLGSTVSACPKAGTTASCCGRGGRNGGNTCGNVATAGGNCNGGRSHGNACGTGGPKDCTIWIPTGTGAGAIGGGSRLAHSVIIAMDAASDRSTRATRRSRLATIRSPKGTTRAEAFGGGGPEGTDEPEGIGAGPELPDEPEATRGSSTCPYPSIDFAFTVRERDAIGTTVRGGKKQCGHGFRTRAPLYVHINDIPCTNDHPAIAKHTTTVTTRSFEIPNVNPFIDISIKINKESPGAKQGWASPSNGRCELMSWYVRMLVCGAAGRDVSGNMRLV